LNKKEKKRDRTSAKYTDDGHKWTAKQSGKLCVAHEVSSECSLIYCVELFFFRRPSFMFLKPPRAEFLKSFSPFPLSNVRPFLFVFRLPQDAGSRL